MAYSTLLSLERTINQILDHDRFSIPPCEEKLIISLDKCVISFQAFLEDFPEKAKDLEGRIRDVATEADDIIEWFLQEQIRYAYRYTKWIAILRGIMFKYQLGKLRDEMESMAEQVVEITNTIIIKDVQLGDSVAATSSSQVEDTGQANIVGFSKDMIEIMEKLCGREPQLQVIPIFGMGGIGKTNLARNAYDEQLVIEHFQIRAWMTISQNYSPRQILLDLLDSIKEFESNWRKESMVENSEKCDDNMVERFEQSKESPREIIEQSQVEISDQSNSKMAERYEHGTESLAKTVELSNSEIALKVHKILIGRRFLIVIDDIWSRKVLDDVKHLFPNENKGSRIILTTRLTEVATYANSSTLPHKMRLMDAHQSWNLLRQKVFGSQDPIPHELEIIGWEIARSCGGLPLAIVVIAGVLSTMSKTQSSWKKVAKNIRSSLVITDGQIEKILSLSYNHLPHHLRSCFMHVGGFPEDHEIKATDLIRLWIAESFVKPVVLKEFEVIAEEYLEDLVDRSLIIVTKRKSNGKIKCCGLHDMVREMCIKIAEKEKFLVHVNGRQAAKVLKSFQDQRRISIYDSDLYTFSNISSSTIRTIIYFQCDGLDSFGSFRLLGILDLLGVRYTSKSVSDQVFELFHLRYLAFRYSHPIPRAISNLQSLQTLIMKGYMHERLPYEIWNLRKLRHFIFSGSYLAFSGDALENLQSLGVVDNLFCSRSNLNKIQNIKKLWLSYGLDYGELLFHNLAHLNQLEKLHSELRDSRREDYGNPNLVLPPSLKKLTLIGWGKSEPYLHIVGPFPNLEVLKLKSFNFSPQVWRTTDGDFPQLKFLLIEKSDIEEWETESSHFPRLKTLLIHSCMDLTEIPECIGEIPTLDLIELKLCLESLAKSARWIQKEAAESYGDDDVFQVRCIDCKPPPSPPRQTQLTVSSHRRVNYPKKPRLPEPRLTRPLTYMLRYPKRYNKLFKRT